MLSFVGKHLSFYPKDVCSFSVFFIYINEKELNQQVYLIKYVENEISKSKKKERERSKNIIQLQKYF